MERLTKEIRKHRKKDKREGCIHMVEEEMDLRDKWMGLKRLKRGLTEGNMEN